MENLFKFMTCSFLILSLAACSDGGGDSKNYAKSLQNIEEVANNFNRIQRAAPGGSNLMNKSNLQAMASSEADIPVYEKTRRMEEAMKRCTVNPYTSSTEPNESGNVDIRLGFYLSGECPVVADMYFGIQFANNEASGRYKVHMEIADPNLAALNDVSFAKIDGGFTANEKGVSGTTTGKIVSKKFGDVDVNGSISSSGNNDAGRLEERLSFTIQEEIVEFVKVTTAQQENYTHAYAINGQTVTEDEFNQAMSKLGFLGLGASTSEQSSELPPEEEVSRPGSPNKPGKPVDQSPKPEYQCRLDVLEFKKYWSTEDAITACRSADYNCVMDVLVNRPNINPSQVNQLCAI